MTRRLKTVIPVVVVGVVATVLLINVFTGWRNHANPAAAALPAPASADTSDPAPSGPCPQAATPPNPWDATQVANADAIIAVGAGMGVPPRGWVIAVATAMQESHLHNYPDLGAANDHDSLGLFQQRPSMGWGTVEQLQDPTYEASAFYNSLLKVSGWQGLALTVAAQRVQKSAFPDAYAKWEPDATALVQASPYGAALCTGTT